MDWKIDTAEKLCFCRTNWTRAKPKYPSYKFQYRPKQSVFLQKVSHHFDWIWSWNDIEWACITDPSSADSGNVDCDPRESFQPLNSVRPASAEDNSRRPMPLELLLNSTLVLEERQSSSHHDESTEESTAAAHQHLMESMTISEKQCKHLAALLAESEANEARLSQLTEALKEEIRRTQRSEERQKHIENLEYLKNVVLKVNHFYFQLLFEKSKKKIEKCLTVMGIEPGSTWWEAVTLTITLTLLYLLLWILNSCSLVNDSTIIILLVYSC